MTAQRVTYHGAPAVISKITEIPTPDTPGAVEVFPTCPCHVGTWLIVGLDEVQVRVVSTFWPIWEAPPV